MSRIKPTADRSTAASTAQKSQENNSFRKTALAVAVGTAVAFGNSASAIAQDATLEEITVTATRRDAAIEDVPYNISAVTGEDLDQNLVTGSGDLFRTIPGVTYVEHGARSGVNNANIILRGINAEDLARNNGPYATAPVVSQYINETPMFVTLRLKDIERVEVLRGPQGTLYGSGSLGGSMRFIYKRPDFDGFSAQVEGGIGSTSGSDDLNYSADAILNIPFSDTFAARMAVGYEENAGFIDKPAQYVVRADGSPELDTGATDPVGDSANFFAGQPVFESVEDVNDSDSTSARAALRWMPTDRFEANLTFQTQEDNSGGTQMNSWDMFGKDSMQNATLIEEPFTRDVDVLALDGQFDMAFATFTASVSDYKSEGTGRRDLTGNYETFSFYVSYYGTSPRPLIEDNSTFSDEGTVIEARLASSGDSSGSFDWVIGVFSYEQDTVFKTEQYYRGYDDYSVSCFIETGTFGGAPCGFGTLFGIEPTNGPVEVTKDFAYVSNQDNKFEDRAVFGEVTWHITDRFQITGGFRSFDQDFSTTQVGGLAFVPGGVESRSLSTSNSDTLFKLNTSFAINDSTNIYATWSEGFRRGGANGLPVNAFGAPVNPNAFTYKPDKTENREVGLKGVLKDRFRYTVAAFDIDWNNIQVNTGCTPLALLCVVNAGEADSKGIEIEFSGAVTDAFDINAGYTYADTELKSLSSELNEFNNDGTVFFPYRSWRDIARNRGAHAVCRWPLHSVSQQWDRNRLWPERLISKRIGVRHIRRLC